MAVQGMVLACTFAVSHNVAEAKIPEDTGGEAYERDWGVQQVRTSAVGPYQIRVPSSNNVPYQPKNLRTGCVSALKSPKIEQNRQLPGTNPGTCGTPRVHTLLETSFQECTRIA